MAVTVDQSPLKCDELGLLTVGQVLAHVQREKRVVVHVLIDGQEPDLSSLPQIKQSALSGHTVYIETADPREMAGEILAEVQTHLGEADRLKSEAADLLRSSQWAPAMEKLAGCFSLWQHAQQSVLGTAQLMKIDLDRIRAAGKSLAELTSQFTAQLRDIKSALESRDFVTLIDLLVYETTETTQNWRSVIEALSGMVRVA
jgi:hypothetical protein